MVSAAIALGAGGRILLGGSPDRADLPVPDRPAYGAVAASAAHGPVRASSAAGVEASATPLAAVGVTGAALPGSGTLLVHVVGQVRHPGLVRLSAGARVADAVAAAGGAAVRADLAGVNLARVLVDGEQLRVPALGEAAAPATATGASVAVGAGSPVDLNHADTSALDALPGIGPVMAQRIVDYRTQHGTFRRIEELAEIPGIGERTLERLRPLVRVG